MTINEWKEKAFEGGYSQVGFPEGTPDLNTMLLSPSAWQAVGKASGWRVEHPTICKVWDDINTHCTCGQKGMWQQNMLAMINALCEAHTKGIPQQEAIEEFLATIV